MTKAMGKDAREHSAGSHHDRADDPVQGLDRKRWPLVAGHPLDDGVAGRGDAQQPRQIFAIAAGGGTGFVESRIGPIAFLSITFDSVQ
jgi:hypothetical protein